jgi:transcriptional regulator of acetoin/glycerol metabolism
MEALLGHSWPGNVRELEHVIERASRFATCAEIAAEDLPAAHRQPGPTYPDVTARG